MKNIYKVILNIIKFIISFTPSKFWRRLAFDLNLPDELLIAKTESALMVVNTSDLIIHT